jgi:hypothetical protein
MRAASHVEVRPSRLGFSMVRLGPMRTQIRQFSIPDVSSVARVSAMSEPQMDPAGNTQAFRAFAQNQDAEAAQKQPSRLPIWIAVGVAVVVVLAVVVYLLAG